MLTTVRLNSILCAGGEQDGSGDFVIVQVIVTIDIRRWVIIDVAITEILANTCPSSGGGCSGSYCSNVNSVCNSKNCPSVDAAAADSSGSASG